MLSIILTSHDVLYLATKLGALALVLFACWLVPKLQAHYAEHHQAH
ncbi:MAG: hypothetical protein ACTS2F_20475 [Thainema sp.]